ncbi:MAG: outer membrane beta-barrel family protein [Bacteroidota bacterium]
MRNLKIIITLLAFLATSLFYSQERPQGKKIIVTGKIVETASNQPLEYTSVSLVNTKTNKITAGGITDEKGDFSFEATPGNYNVKVEFISFKPLEIKDKTITDNTNLGTIKLQNDATQLDEVQVRAEKTTVEIKLDKKVYNVGKDLMVKGGTVSDVLDNIPSVSVDVEGNISLRGNENVRVLIDGKPSNAISITEALKIIPADAIDKVEVITNPSARYDAEGGGGILNIVLKKGKTSGTNGTFMATTGYPDNHGVSGTVNFKDTEFNVFTTQSYNYRSNPGNAFTDSRYLNPDNTTKSYVNETRDNDRLNKGYNGNFGMDWFLDKSTTWTNIVSYRKSSGDNEDNVLQDNFNQNYVYTYTRNRVNSEISKSENIEFSTNLTKNFKKDGHKLTIDGSFSKNKDDNTALIVDTTNNSSTVGIDNTYNNQKQNRNLITADYVLPIGKKSQFELGYRGDFSKLVTDYGVTSSGNVNNLFTNLLEYKEKVNALYTSFGTKVSKFSFLFGMRWEDSEIDVNLLRTNDLNNKKYDNFFPSAFVAYEFSEKSSASLSYSKRIQRPRGRFLNPFNGLSSNTNTFVGNPDLNPAFTDAFDLGYLKRWTKLTFNTSLYVNKTTGSFQFVRNPTGEVINGVDVIQSTSVNVATEYRTGFEFTLNYSPYKWWKLNSNFNFFRVETQGDYTYTTSTGDEVYQDLANTATTWSTRLSSKINLPYKIDWQTNFNYNGPQTSRQGKSLGVLAANLAFSKDVLKDKGTLAFNISDVFNSRKRIMDTYLPGVVESHGEMQWRERQFTLSFTYRFNKPKNEKEKPKRPTQDDGGGEFPG